MKMFHDIPKTIQERMHYLERLNEQQKRDEVSPLLRLRQIPPETGKFLAILAATAPAGTYLEIGTSAGYSTLWIALACRMLGRRLVTFEILEEKVRLAKETFASANVEDFVELVQGDAREYIQKYKDISFCFLDAEKEIYLECYAKVVPGMIKGGLLVADNIISHKEVLGSMVNYALTDERIDAVVVPIGSGELVCRKL